MPDSNDKSSRPAAPAQAGSKTPGSIQAIARRKAILKGLGKTAAVAGAASPLASLATTRLRYESSGKNYQCSVSGHMSVLHSASPQNVPLCSGKSPVNYRSKNLACNDASNTAENWPMWPTKLVDSVNRPVCYSQAGQTGTAYLPTAQFNIVFGSGVTKKIGQMINDGDADAHWVAALINATKYPTTFPHTPDEVIQQYRNETKRAAALSFYQLHVHKG